MRWTGQGIRPSWRGGPDLRFNLRFGRRLSLQPRDHRIGLARNVLRQITEVDDVGRLEGPDERLNPRHHRQETDPAHEIDRVRLRTMAMRPGRPSRKISTPTKTTPLKNNTAKVT